MTVRAPNHLSDAAKQKFRELIREGFGVLDRDLVAHYADTYARWIEACQEVDRRGAIQETRTGYTAPTAAAVMRDKLSAELLKVAKAFRDAKLDVEQKNQTGNSVFDLIEARKRKAGRG